MVQSLNTKVTYKVKATSFTGINSYGDILLGDKAFEYYNERNVADYIQIPYKEIDFISASVVFKRKIVRFAIFTKKNGHFTFSSRDNKRTLKQLSNYIPVEKMYKSKSLLEVAKAGICRIIKRER